MSKRSIAPFEHHVELKYRVYNSVFLTLKFEQIRQTGIHLPILQNLCKNGFQAGETPLEIIEGFFQEYFSEESPDTQLDLLFRFIQYMERQVVMIDALEDASFENLNNLEGHGTFHHLFETAGVMEKRQQLFEKLKDFKVRIVLTAHPTQFYPGSVLGIITDLGKSLHEENLMEIRQLLEQLGKTPFFKREKPTPFDEAVSLNWYLENVFYDAISDISREIKDLYGDGPEMDQIFNHELLEVGFWPGGDRDGNPFVDRDTTLKVARRLKNTLLKCYYRDVRNIRRRVTFRGVDQLVEKVERALYRSIYKSEQESELQLESLRETLQQISHQLQTEHNGLFIEQVSGLLNKMHIFGFHFATIDIRQDSRVLQEAFDAVTDPNSFAKNDLESYFEASGQLSQYQGSDNTLQDSLHVFKTIRQIQQENGEKGCNRFIISNCRNGTSVVQVLTLARLNGWKAPYALDVVPLFETITDLEKAADSMRELYSTPSYRKHLETRGNKQVVMLGFSDGTKDGGYFAANWNIYKAKEAISKASREFDVKVIFFDGRGGPPARGGGNVHRFYAAQGSEIAKHQIQLTIQGQTVSSKFGNRTSARFYLEQLLTAGLGNLIRDNKEQKEEKYRELTELLSAYSLHAYRSLKEHPQFVDYLAEASPLSYFGQTNIASRPTKRGRSSKLSIADLRAIPFVGSWSQLKQNVPGYYGFGTALERLKEEGRMEELKELYQNSPFFQALISNSMQSLSKCFFPLTRHLADHPRFGELWHMIHEEYERTCALLLEVCGMKSLMENSPRLKASIQLREEIVLPLLTIQQFALMKLHQSDIENKEVYQKLVIRSMYGIINAARNSA
jgi:phosphoenolpyruvate carboxylase